MAAEISAINFHFARDFAAFVFVLHGLADFVGHVLSGFVLDAKLAGKLDSRASFNSVHEQEDCGQKVHKGQLAAGEESARRDAELAMASLALELAARGDGVGFAAAALRAHSNAIGFRPAELADGLVSGLLTGFVNLAQREGSGSGREKKVLGHTIISDGVPSNVMVLGGAYDEPKRRPGQSRV